jgi:hypothetical protein
MSLRIVEVGCVCIYEFVLELEEVNNNRLLGNWREG